MTDGEFWDIERELWLGGPEASGAGWRPSA